MGDGIEGIGNTLADDVRPGMEVPRHAPEADSPPSYGPVARRLPVMVDTNDDGRDARWLRAAARRQAGPMDPSVYLTHGE
jgi:hypothetical protein